MYVFVDHAALLSLWQGKRLSQIFKWVSGGSSVPSVGEACKSQLQSQFWLNYISSRLAEAGFRHYSRCNFELNINSTGTSFLQNSIFEKTLHYFSLCIFPLFIIHIFNFCRYCDAVLICTHAPGSATCSYRSLKLEWTHRGSINMRLKNCIFKKWPETKLLIGNYNR